MKLDKKKTGWCVPDTFFNLFTRGISKEGEIPRAVRVAVFNISPGVNHYQAQVQDYDGNWQYLSEVWTGECMASSLWPSCNYDPDLTPIKYLSVREAFEEQIQLFVGKGEVK
ncbi:MAG: hypothetical protein WC208_15005 [Gallionella sp.]|jgi:hypothetical protein